MLEKEEISREELLLNGESQRVHTTTPTASPSVPKPRKKKKKGEDKNEKAKISAAKARAKKLFDEKTYSAVNKSSEDTIEALRKELQLLKQQLPDNKIKGNTNSAS